MAALGCSEPTDTGPAFAFARPEHLGFACFAPRLPPDQMQHEVLPAECCRINDDKTADYEQKTALAASLASCQRGVLGTPVLHALVSQSARGEIAAVDLSSANRVIDSDRLVPGYTFIDVGGLPSAIVVPPHQPGRPGEGPKWTYVASAEGREVRAVATCRFRTGDRCGPDASGVPLISSIELPAAPRHMVYEPSGAALWVTLPDRGWLARIALPQAAGGAEASPEEPFVMAGGMPAQPLYYAVSLEGLVPLAESPAKDGSDYERVCGLGAPFRANERKLPIAPRQAVNGSAAPLRMHLDGDLLLVSDGRQPVLHVFRLAEGQALQPLGPFATGAPLRTFVLTKPVPAKATSIEDMIRQDSPIPPEPGEGGDSKRYLYAIDDRDGSLMLFDFKRPSADFVELTPLLAPVPGLYADRVSVPGPLTDLEIIDTRTQSDYVCGESYRVPLDEQVIARSEQQAEVEARLAARIAKPTQEDAATLAELELQRKHVQERIGEYEKSSSSYLRGVFLAASASNGTLSIVDIHDLDVACRARRNCKADVVSAIDLAPRGLPALRRHAPRLSAVGSLTASAPGNTSLVGIASCDDEAYRLGLPAQPNHLVCAPADPWSSADETWAVQYRGALPNTRLTGGRLEFAGEQVTLFAPRLTNLCTRGVLDGDVVAILGEPAADRASTCTSATLGNETLLRVSRAYADKLELVPLIEPNAPPGKTAASVIALLKDCYPDFASFEVRAGAFLVLGAGGTYLHDVVADAADDDHCVRDPERDDRFNSRIGIAGGRFSNPYVSFTLREFDNDQDPATPVPADAFDPDARSRETTVQVRNGATTLQRTAASSSQDVLEALPTSLRYVPEWNNLFVLDATAQGLLRYRLRPLEAAARPVR